MSSWKVVFLLCGLVWGLDLSESVLETPHEAISEPDLDCAFETSTLCNWKDVSTSDTIKWKTYNSGSSSYSHQTGPLTDHTTGHGYFLSMRTTHKYDPGNALLESAPIVTSNETCLSFWYYMYGTRVGGLNVYKIGGQDQKNETFTMFGPQGKRWYRAVINTGDGVFKLQIEATFIASRDYSDIAIDDIDFSYQSCQEDESALLKDQPRIDCDFEQDFCSWDFYEKNRLTWRMKHVSSNSEDRNALPPGSNGTSYAQMVDTQHGYNYETSLEGPTISVDSSEACLSFWYKINGSAIRNFRVRAYEHGESSYYGGKTLFSTDFNTGPVWIRGLVTVPETNNSFFVFNVRSKRQGGSTFGLDDIRLTRGRPCIEDQKSLINCDFEKDFCRWYMKTKKNEGDWLRTKDPTPTNSTGPSQDHTTGDGYYIFLDASDVQEAILYSTPFSVNSSGACLSFWYHMHGVDVHTLKLSSFSSSYFYSGVNWLLKGPQGDQWIQQNISLNPGYNIYLVFTASRGYFPRGDIALDDISITFGAPCISDSDKETTVPATFSPEIETMTDSLVGGITTRTPPTTTTEVPPLETPQLLVKGKINPAFNNSRVELVCQHNEENVWIRWYKRTRISDYVGKDKINNEYRKTILFEEIHPKDAAFYSCSLRRYGVDASNSSNEVEIRVVPDPRPSPHLTIRYEADDVYYENPIDVQAESVIKLECGVEINGGEYQWRTTSRAFNSLNLPKERVLVLNGTQPKHTGIYSCRISKDEFMTAKSNELNIAVREGKRCKYDWSCYGDSYIRLCKSHRCECHRNAVYRGRECKARPNQPKIITSPSFLEFGIGESFYLVCEADEPAPANLTYTFKTRYQYKESLGILKITHATEEDTGMYSCHVTYNDINSRESKGINIQIKDFIDLNCDFTKDLCAWLQNNDTDTEDFAPASSDDHRQIGGPSNPFLQLDASNTTVPNSAILSSPVIDRMALDSCLTFWYRMQGPDVLSLSVWRYIYSDESNEFGGSKLWTMIGDQGDAWLKQSVTVGNGSRFFIAFDAKGHAAIDDITFTYRGAC